MKLVIRLPQSAERREAMELALAALPSELRQAIIAAGGDERPPQHAAVLGAWRGEQLVGAVWGEIQAGRAGYLYAPRVIEDEPLATALALLAAWEEWVREQGARFFQIQLDEASADDVFLLTAAGMKHAGDLLYLASDLTFAKAPPPGMEFEPYRDSQQERLAALLARTYENSLDLPMLDEVRAPGEVLEGYRCNGAFRPELWRFVRQAGIDVGCLLLTEHPHRQWELVYMGLVPEARGRRLGHAVAAYAQALVGDLGGDRLLLAVDAANYPALAAYRQGGFEVWRRCLVFLKMLNPAGG
jgi:ribosomal protein S18 acetylase RimI-like enzyme